MGSITLLESLKKEDKLKLFGFFWNFDSDFLPIIKYGIYTDSPDFGSMTPSTAEFQFYLWKKEHYFPSDWWGTLLILKDDLYDPKIYLYQDFDRIVHRQAIRHLYLFRILIGATFTILKFLKETEEYKIVSLYKNQMLILDLSVVEMVEDETNGHQMYDFVKNRLYSWFVSNKKYSPDVPIYV